MTSRRRGFRFPYWNSIWWSTGLRLSIESVDAGVARRNNSFIQTSTMGKPGCLPCISELGNIRKEMEERVSRRTGLLQRPEEAQRKATRGRGVLPNELLHLGTTYCFYPSSCYGLRMIPNGVLLSSLDSPERGVLYSFHIKWQLAHSTMKSLLQNRLVCCCFK